MSLITYRLTLLKIRLGHVLGAVHTVRMAHGGRVLSMRANMCRGGSVLGIECAHKEL